MKPPPTKPRVGSRILTLITTLAIVALFAVPMYFFRGQIGVLIQDLSAQFFPCAQPIPYSIGTFDTRFGISKADFLKAIGQAESIWETPIHKQLFQYTDTGSLKINLIYDQRQAATIKLQQAGITVHGDKAGYDQLNAKYTSLQRSYQTQKAALDAAVTDFNQKNVAYANEVARWNKRGGAPQTVYDQLQQEQADLKAQSIRINQMETTLNQTVDTLNSVVAVLNRLAATLNLALDTYNTIGSAQGTEFEEGKYTSDAQGRQITIYQFDDKAKLIRVLAHELGHALGLDHLDNPAAVMYRLNVGTNEKLTTDDIAALKNRCGIK